MKIVLLAAAAMIATPLVAQTTPAAPAPAGDPSTMSAPPPAQTTPPATDSSMAPAPTATTPPAAAPAPADAAAGAGQPMAAAPMAPGASGDAMAAPTPATGKLPLCRAGQFTGCRERSNAKGEGLRKN